MPDGVKRAFDIIEKENSGDNETEDAEDAEHSHLGRIFDKVLLNDVSARRYEIPENEIHDFLFDLLECLELGKDEKGDGGDGYEGEQRGKGESACAEEALIGEKLFNGAGGRPGNDE